MAVQHVVVWTRVFQPLVPNWGQSGDPKVDSWHYLETFFRVTTGGGGEASE